MTRIREWAKNIESGRKAQGATYGSEVTKAGVKALSKEEAHSRLSNAPSDGRTVNINFYSGTLEDVGREFGVTRERVRQIEAKTLAKLRHPMRSQRLKEFLDEE